MNPSPESRRAGHETSEVPLRPVLRVLLLFLILAAAVYLGTTLFTRALAGQEKGFGQAYSPAPNQSPAYPAPALQVNPQVDLQTYRYEAERDLNGYGPADPARGTVRIPIGRAMDLLSARGLPVRPPAQDGGTEQDMQARKAADDRDRALAQPPERRRP